MEKPIIALIVFAIPILFGSISARRINFLQGFIVTLCWYFIFAGIYTLFGRIIGDTDFYKTLYEYMSYAIIVPTTFTNLMLMHLEIDESIVEYIDIIVTIAPLIFMVLTSIIFRIFRRKK